MCNINSILTAVTRATGVSASQIKGPSRKWRIHEARMLFVLSLARLGVCDSRIALAINRTRPTALKTRHYAEDYIGISAGFSEKFSKAWELYVKSQNCAGDE